MPPQPLQHSARGVSLLPRGRKEIQIVADAFPKKSYLPFVDAQWSQPDYLASAAHFQQQLLRGIQAAEPGRMLERSHTGGFLKQTEPVFALPNGVHFVLGPMLQVRVRAEIPVCHAVLRKVL